MHKKCKRENYYCDDITYKRKNNKMIIKPGKERLHKERGEWEGVFKSYYPEVDTEEII